MPILVCKQIIFYSAGDEKSFFQWAERTKGIQKIEGVGNEIRIHAKSQLSDSSLREMLAIFHRYNIEMRQLRKFSTKTNKHWFKDEQKFWFKQVFKG